MQVVNENIKKRSGKVSLLYEEEWTEIIKTGRGKEKDVEFELIVPEHCVFSMRFPKADINKKIRIFIENVDKVEKTEGKYDNEHLDDNPA
jgi:hypothetical protein